MKFDTQESVEEHKELLSKVYSKRWLKSHKKYLDWNPVKRKIYSKLIENLDKSTAKIFEPAIGLGSIYSRKLSHNDFNVYGIDISEELVNECNKINLEF